MKDYPPISQYEDAEGYEFSWGHILERRTRQYLVWEFCLSSLLSQYLNKGRRLNDLQRDVFVELEKRMECATRDIVQVLTMNDGWKIIPCSAVGVFTLVIHFTEEREAREWAVDHLLNTAVPDVIGKLSGQTS